MIILRNQLRTTDNAISQGTVRSDKQLVPLHFVRMRTQTGIA